MAPVLIGFFNGVWNSEWDASEALRQVGMIYEYQYLSTPIEYDLFYNQTGCERANATCLEDLAEVFAQRDHELEGVLKSRWEYFWDLLNGRYTSPNSLAGGAVVALGSTAVAFADLLDGLFNRGLHCCAEPCSGTTQGSVAGGARVGDDLETDLTDKRALQEIGDGLMASTN